MSDLTPERAMQLLRERGMSEAQISAALTARAERKRQDALHTHQPTRVSPELKLRRQAAGVFGVPTQQVDMQGPTGKQRVRLGLLDAPESAQQYLSQRYPTGAEIIEQDGQRHVAFQRPDGTVSFANPPGFEWGDVGEFYTREGPTVAGGTLGAVAGMPGSLLGMTGGAFAGAAAGEALRRGLARPMAGGETLSTQDIAPIGAMAGTEAAGPLIGKVLRGPTNLMAGRGAMQEGPMRTHLANIDRLADEVPDLRMPVPQRMSEGKIFRGTGRQVESTSNVITEKEKAARQHSVDLLKATVDDYKEAGTLIPELQEIAENYLARADAAIRYPLRRPGTGGRAAVDAFDNWVSSSRNQVTAAYNKLDDIAEADKPTFDLTPLADVSTRYEIPGIAVLDSDKVTEGADAVRKFINVSRDPEGKLARTVSVLERLAPEQVDYKVLKELRTQIGQAIETWPWDADRGTGIARRLYGDLTKVMNNPVSGGARFADQHKTASQLARHRFYMLDNQSYRSLAAIGRDSPERLAQALANDSTLLTQPVTEMLTKSYNKQNLDTLRLSLMDQIAIGKGSARANLKRWWDANPKNARAIFRGQYHQAQRIAKATDALNSKRIAQIAQRLDDRAGPLKTLVEGLDPGSAKTLLKDLGGRGSRGHTIARVAIHENLIDRAIKISDDSQYLDPKVLYQEIEKLKGSGAWDMLLDSADRKRLEAMRSYAQLIAPEGGDTGVSLQRAAAIANLRHPATFFKGVHTLSVNRALAIAMSSDKLSRTILRMKIGAGKEPLPPIDVNAAGALMMGVVNYMNDMGR